MVGVRESEFAETLVRMLGLSRSLPPAPSTAQRFAALMGQGISPKGGWNATNLVTRGNLARVVVQALGKAGEVEDQNDDAAWINYANSLGIDFSTVSEAVQPITNNLPSGQNGTTDTDPLAKSKVPAAPGDIDGMFRNVSVLPVRQPMTRN